MTAIITLTLAIVCILALRVTVKAHDEILHDSENEKY
jgi:hypothetical protein